MEEVLEAGLKGLIFYDDRVVFGFEIEVFDDDTGIFAGPDHFMWVFEQAGRVFEDVFPVVWGDLVVI